MFGSLLAALGHCSNFERRKYGLRRPRATGRAVDFDSLLGLQQFDVQMEPRKSSGSK